MSKTLGSGVSNSDAEWNVSPKNHATVAFLPDVTPEPGSQIGKSLFLYRETVILKRKLILTPAA